MRSRAFRSSSTGTNAGQASVRVNADVLLRDQPEDEEEEDDRKEEDDNGDGSSEWP
jgi:hypothetical protein